MQVLELVADWAPELKSSPHEDVCLSILQRMKSVAESWIAAHPPSANDIKRVTESGSAGPLSSVVRRLPAAAYTSLLAPVALAKLQSFESLACERHDALVVLPDALPVGKGLVVTIRNVA